MSLYGIQCPVTIVGGELPEFIELSHGSGGKMTHHLIESLFLPLLRNGYLERMEDQAIMEPHPGRIAVSTDSFVVKPYKFLGGNIGDLAVNGTVNDLLMGGATPMYLTASFILAEGLKTTDLHDIVFSMAKAAEKSHVQIVTGDTKVVERTAADGLYISTSGVGYVPNNIHWNANQIREGDVIILSGTIADHGASIMASRFEMDFETQIQSDTASLYDLVLAVRDVPGIRCMRDPTRGGVATTLVELSRASKLTLNVSERSLPIREDVRGMCEILGLDPLYVANEGKLVTVVSPEDADEVLSRMRCVLEGENACLVGKVVDEVPGFATLTTNLGASRVLDLLAIEQLPRIC